jgi:hypothetical protein
MALKYSKWPLKKISFSIKGPWKFYQIEIFGMKMYHLATVYAAFKKVFAFESMGWLQGDQIGKIFACWVSVYFGQYLAKLQKLVARIIGLHVYTV